MKKLLLLCLVLLGGVMQASASDTWYLKGSFNDWGTNNPFSTGSVSLNLTAGDIIQFKVVKNNGSSDTWYGATNSGFNFDWTVSSTTAFSTNAEARNFMLFAHLTGTYTFSLTTSDGNPTNLSITSPSGTYEKTTIYFCNTLSWTTPYFYIRKNAYYDGTKGSGSNQCPNGMAMTKIGETNIWKAEFPTSFLDADIAFLDRKQDSYDNFYDANASVRGDFSIGKPVFAPSTTKNDTKNSTDYYSNGEWHPFPTYTRTVTEGKFGTICLPFDATIDGADVYEISSKVMSGETLTGINLSSVTNLTAGVAYIFKAKGSTLTATLSGNYSDAIAANGMMGNLSSEKVTVTNGNYIVKDNQIRLVGLVGEVGEGNKVTCGQYRGYITLANIASATARSANFMGFEDETTGIANVDVNANDNIDANAPMYNLAGQRVTKNYKGVVIVNGKKVVLK